MHLARREIIEKLQTLIGSRQAAASGDEVIGDYLEIAQAELNNDSLSAACNSIAAIFLTEKDLCAAREWLTQAAHFSHKENNCLQSAMKDLYYGMLYDELNEPVEAELYFNFALESFNDSFAGFTFYHAIAQQQLIKLYLAADKFFYAEQMVMRMVKQSRELAPPDRTDVINWLMAQADDCQAAGGEQTAALFHLQACQLAAYQHSIPFIV